MFPCPLCNLPLACWRQLYLPLAFSFSYDWRSQFLSLPLYFPFVSQPSNHPTLVGPSAGLVPVCQCLSSTRDPKTGHDTPKVISQMQNRKEDDQFDSAVGYTLADTAQYLVSHFHLQGSQLTTNAMCIGADLDHRQLNPGGKRLQREEDYRERWLPTSQDNESLSGTFRALTLLYSWGPMKI